MQTLILNCAILTQDGNFELKTITLEESKELVKGEVLSAVGHKATAEILTSLLEKEIPVNRIQAKQETGQIAIVFSMNKRIEEGRILSLEEIKEIGFTFKKLERIN